MTDPSLASDGLHISWCGPEAAQVIHDLTQVAFAGQEGLQPPSGATRETLEVVRADLEAGRGVLVRVGVETVAAARVLIFEDHVYVRRVAVDPRFRRRGLASKLMGWLHDEIAELGYGHVILGVRKALPANRLLYEKLGYYLVEDHGFWVELRYDLRLDRAGPTTAPRKER